MHLRRTGAPSIRTRIFLWTSAAMVLVITLMVLLLHDLTASQIKKDRIEIHTMETQNQLDKLDNYLMTLMVKTDSLFVNEDFSSLIATVPTGAANQASLNTNIRKYMDVAVYSLRYPEISIADYPGGQVYACLYSANDRTYVDNEFVMDYRQVREEPFVQELMTERRMFSWNVGVSSSIGRFIAFNRRLLDYRNLADVGILQIRIPLSKVSQILQQEKPESALTFCYLDMNGAVLYTDGSLELPGDLDLQNLQDGEFVEIPAMGGSCLISRCYSSLNEMSLISMASARDLGSDADFMAPIFLGGGIATVAICMLCLFGLSGVLLRGLRQLTEKTQKAGSSVDAYQKLGPIRDTREVEMLDTSFGEMLTTIHRLYGEEARYKDVLNEVEIELTQEQFNPHLLYNTLSLLRHLNAENGQEEANVVVDNLISFYRRALNRGQIVIRVREEIQMISSYIDIVRNVYQMELDVRLDVAEEILDCRSVKLFLQPIVENAIMHGLREVGSGSLNITGRREGENLFFIVEDDGLGIERDKLAQIRRAIADPEGSGPESYGFVSIVRRLGLFFGNDYALTVDSVAGEGTRVEIRIPAYGEEQISAVLKSKLI